MDNLFFNYCKRWVSNDAQFRVEYHKINHIYPLKCRKNEVE